MECSVLDSSVGSANKLQQKEEDLNDVDVDGQSSEHVLLLTDGMFSVSNQELGMIRQELWRDGNMDYNTFFFFFFLCQHYMPHPYQSEDNGTHSCIQHVKPRNLQQQPDVTTGRKKTRTWEKNKNSRISLALTHIFKGQHDDCDDARHEHDHPQDAEKSLTLGEVHLFFKKKTTTDM